MKRARMSWIEAGAIIYMTALGVYDLARFHWMSSFAIATLVILYWRYGYWKREAAHQRRRAELRERGQR